MQEPLIPAPESLPVRRNTRRRNRRIAIARMMVEHRRPVGLDVMLRRLETIVIALIFDRPVVQRRRRRRSINRLRMRASKQRRRKSQSSDAEKFLHRDPHRRFVSNSIAFAYEDPMPRPELRPLCHQPCKDASPLRGPIGLRQHAGHAVPRARSCPLRRGEGQPVPAGHWLQSSASRWCSRPPMRSFAWSYFADRRCSDRL